MKKEQEQYQIKGKSYFECVFVDNEKEDFGKKCTYIKEFGKNGDMLSFGFEQCYLEQSTILQIIPKSQIRKIVQQNLVLEEKNSLE